MAGVTWRADDLNVGGVNAHGSNRDESSNGYAVPVGVDLTEDTKADGSKYGYYGPFCPIIQESCKDDMKADPPPTCAEAKGDLIDETAAQGLCEMLGVSFQDATDALRTFRGDSILFAVYILN